MKIFRIILIRKFMAVLTGLLILNMSLFLAEVEALKFLQDRKMNLNITKLLNGAANEEEQDFADASEEEGFTKETDLFASISFQLPALISSETDTQHCWKSFDIKEPIRETLSPPPKA